MPEKGWYSLTVRKEIAVRVRERARNRGLMVDEFINMLMRPASKGVWSRCIVCGASAHANVSEFKPRFAPQGQALPLEG